MTETNAPRWQLGLDAQLGEDGYAYPLLAGAPGAEPDWRPVKPWTGTLPVHIDLGYPYLAERGQNDVLLLCCFAVTMADKTNEPFWLYQGHGGCSYHVDLDGAGVCNATDGDGHPNLWADLPDGTRLEATWDELAAKPWRTTLSQSFNTEAARALLARFWAGVPRPVNLDQVFASPDLSPVLADPAVSRDLLAAVLAS